MHVCFSNRPFLVKHFQTIHHCGVDVARGLVLLFGIGARALPSWDSRTRRNNLMGGLAVRRTAGPSRHANSPHPSSREGHLSTARWNSSFLLSGLILNGFHAAATVCSRVLRDVRSWVNSGKHVLTLSFSRFGPLTDFALHWLRCGHQEFCTKIAVEQFQRVAQRHRVLVGCAAASMRYHDEIRVFSRLMAKSVVGNNQ